MNYRHAYHAGNFADVFKHCLLIELLEALRGKAKPFAYIDTHAGAGRYDLQGAAARRTGEWREGVARVLAAEAPPATVSRYRDLLLAAGAPRWYPGSPVLAAALLRDTDRAILCEGHPEEAAALRALYRRSSSVAVHGRDGYEALRGLLPPTERRGLVLVDPPFEVRGEFENLIEALRTAHARWPTGIFAFWYPVVHAAHVQSYRDAVRRTGIRSVLDVRFSPARTELPGSFDGCGVIVVNPPWRFPATVAAWLPWLARCLAADGTAGRAETVWLAGE